MSWLRDTTIFCDTTKENTNMDKQTVIQNIINNYGQYGITQKTIIPLIDSGIKQGMSYDLIYLGLKMELCKLAGEEFYCTSDEMAKAFDISNEEMDKIIEESRQELLEAGENPDDYFSGSASYKVYAETDFTIADVPKNEVFPVEEFGEFRNQVG